LSIVWTMEERVLLDRWKWSFTHCMNWAVFWRAYSLRSWLREDISLAYDFDEEKNLPARTCIFSPEV
jgi:hypothetical protein